MKTDNKKTTTKKVANKEIKEPILKEVKVESIEDKIESIPIEEFLAEIDEIKQPTKQPDNSDKIYKEVTVDSSGEKILYINDDKLLKDIKEFMMYLNTPRGATPTVENMERLEFYHNMWFGLNYKILCCNTLQCKVYDKMMRLVGLK